jgi:hypothetical protein
MHMSAEAAGVVKTGECSPVEGLQAHCRQQCSGWFRT